MRSSAIPTTYNRVRPAIRKSSSVTMVTVNCGSGRYPDKIRRAVKKQVVQRMTGKNVTPPSLGMGRLWIFRASGASKSRLRREIIRMFGMMIRPRTIAVMKAAIIKYMFAMCSIVLGTLRGYLSQSEEKGNREFE